MLTSASDPALWRGMDRTTLELQYRLANHPDRSTAYARFAADSAVTRETLRWHRVSYGPHPRERLELFEGKADAPVLAFIHGGYWRGLEMEMFSCIARSFVSRGIWVANIEYPLAPELSMTHIARSCFRALRRSAEEVSQRGGNGDHLVVTGHSAGGHLAAAALGAERHVPSQLPLKIAGAVPISGLFDLEPLRRISLNETLNLDTEEALRLSPYSAVSSQMPPVVAAVGGDETAEFQRQSIDYAKQLAAAGNRAHSLIVPGCNHFTVLDALCNPSASLFLSTLELLTSTAR